LFGIETRGRGLYVFVHAGTLLATAFVLRKRATRSLQDGFLALGRKARLAETSGGRDALAVLIATVPSAVLGVLLRGLGLRWASQPLVVGLGFLTTTLVLVLSGLARKGDSEQPSHWGALAIGIAQGFSVLPGLSRSGSTIATALWLGVRPDRAFELSMLISIPAVVLTLILEATRAFGEEGFGIALLPGAVFALATGILSLLALERIVKSGRFAWFALWVGPLSLATIAMGVAWPR
jgi:undecaprenyl-diphosphatase